MTHNDPKPKFSILRLNAAETGRWLEDGRPTRIYAAVVIIIAKPVQSFFTDDNET